MYDAGYGGCFLSKQAKKEDWPHEISYFKDDLTAFAAGHFYGVPGAAVHGLVQLAAPFRFFSQEGGLIHRSLLHGLHSVPKTMRHSKWLHSTKAAGLQAA